MENSFVSYLGTDSFLPGILALEQSIKQHGSKYPLLVMVSESVSENTLSILNKKRISIRLIKEIENPNNLGDDKRGFRFMYTKLRLFEMFEFEKIVYIDADMLICKNIDSLFEFPHMSAVIAGELHPENKAWKDLNAGLMVVEPSKSLFDKIFSSINYLPSTQGDDQGFLHSLYQDWPSNTSLHLDHTFNVPFCYIDEYCLQNDFYFEYNKRSLKTNISVIHHWGQYKPWETDIKSFKRKSAEKWEQALLLWWDTFLSAST